MLASAQDSMLLLYTRYLNMRSLGAKIILWVSGFFVIGLILLSSYAGDMIKFTASLTMPEADTARMLAVTYLRSFQSGELGSLVATTLGLTLISVMIAPFTGISSTSLIPPHSLVSIQASNRHRFFDSFILQLVSSISILQLFTLTAIASLLTLETGRIEGVLFAWAVWPILVALSTFFVWVAELLYRKFGEKRRLMILGIALCVIGTVVLLNQEAAKSVFGIGTSFAYLIQNASSFETGTKILIFTVPFLIFSIIFYLAYKMAFYTLTKPEVHIKDNSKPKKVKQWKPSQFFILEMFHTQIVQIWRNKDVRKSLIVATLFGGAVLFFGGSFSNVGSTMVFIIPLLVSLSWGANIFGIMGTGTLWLFSKPRFNKNIIWILYTIQVLLSVFLFNLMMIPSILTGRLSADVALSMVLAILATSFAMSRSALAKSVHKPFPYKGGVRGENILPPAIILAYTFRLSLWSGMLGFFLMSAENIPVQIIIAGLAIIWSLIRVFLLSRKFNTNADIRNKIIFTVGADQ